MAKCEHEVLKDLACKLANQLIRQNKRLLEKSLNEQIASGLPIQAAISTIVTAITDTAIVNAYGLYHATGGEDEQGFREFLDSICDHIKNYDLSSIRHVG